VEVRKAHVVDAKWIIFEPMDVKLNIGEDFIVFVKRKLMDRPFMEGDANMISVFGSAIPLVVTSTRPNGPVRITEATHLNVLPEPSGEISEKVDLKRMRRRACANWPQEPQFTMYPGRTVPVRGYVKAPKNTSISIVLRRKGKEKDWRSFSLP
jgi:hypothetical protein